MFFKVFSQGETRPMLLLARGLSGVLWSASRGPRRASLPRAANSSAGARYIFCSSEHSPTPPKGGGKFKPVEVKNRTYHTLWTCAACKSIGAHFPQHHQPSQKHRSSTAPAYIVAHMGTTIMSIKTHVTICSIVQNVRFARPPTDALAGCLPPC